MRLKLQLDLYGAMSDTVERLIAAKVAYEQKLSTSSRERLPVRWRRRRSGNNNNTGVLYGNSIERCLRN